MGVKSKEEMMCDGFWAYSRSYLLASVFVRCPRNKKSQPDF
jgi:hypothetical protein